ncbi:MAG: 3-isopropylmalate dehydratase small subunit [Dehalococcoidia bacterium]|nr:3-isopropylmalate dehydratase small subunit [Dehalococcoidia bacterium]
MKLRGNAHKYGANVDTDVIIAARYLNVSDAAELAKHCMEDIDADFVKRVKPGDVMIATTNFGCGSSREHAPVAIKASGISCVIASSFARIFFRNAINIGLPLLECPEAAEETRNGDTIQVDLSSGRIDNVTQGKSFQAVPYPDFLLDIITSGGLIEHTMHTLQHSGRG